MKKIVVPVDFSELSMYAMDFAVEFCQAIGGEIVLMHVLPFPNSQFSFTKEANKQAMLNFYTEEFIEELQGKLDTWARLLKEDDVPVRPVFLYGNPFQKISATLSEEKADFVIMGSKGTSGLKEFLLGSNAARMVRYATCPVIIIKDQTHIKDFASITFATDGTETQDEIAKKVIEIQRLFKLRVQILKVRTPYNWLEESQIIAKLEKFARRNGFSDYETRVIFEDYVDEGAIKYAEEHHSSIIMIGTHGRSGLGHVLSGSNAEDVVNQSTIPVMTFKLE